MCAITQGILNLSENKIMMDLLRLQKNMTAILWRHLLQIKTFFLNRLHAPDGHQYL